MKWKSVRSEYLDYSESIDPEKLIYIDEAGINDNIVVPYSWSEKGIKSYAVQSGFRSETVSIDNPAIIYSLSQRLFG